ncbi:hypothetical protein RND71_038333 [Anisodus tanguticus]|uniref:Transcription initiation factor TFIID component TAF4 C-terminal domain-containing protein n=1 Tax=Anisodus tanguticus TaxID=243964 RepID=A0AAE1UTE6_9SOLA|nr:hypothetical protein RND71_038333 [Anisodus tanguticus]
MAAYKFQSQAARNTRTVPQSQASPQQNLQKPTDAPLVLHSFNIRLSCFYRGIVHRKKQKVSGAFSDQSIEQLNDVTAVSGVNLMEEEHLLSGPREDSRLSEASRCAVQEEEERLILQKIPLQRKLNGIS